MTRSFLSLVAVIATPLVAQQANLAPTQKFARDVYQELIELNSSTTTARTTNAGQAMAKRFRDAGFPEQDIFLGGVRADKFNRLTKVLTGGRTIQ